MCSPWIIILAFQLSSAGGALWAQSTPRDLTSRPLATLAHWADDVWLALTDRDGSFFGRLSDEGTFQRFNPLMDAEYELDVLTGLFTASEDARWAMATQGLRVSGASINQPFILNFIDWREEIPISGPVGLFTRYARQRSLTTQRDYSNVGLEWREVLGSPFALRSSIGMHFFKSSADVEVGVTRNWNQNGRRLWTADLRVAMLDAFNNVIFNALGVQPEETPAHFNYETLPFATRLSVVWSPSCCRVEMRGGLSNRSEVLVSFPASGDPSFALTERVSFAGALAEVAVSQRISLAAYSTTARASTNRQFTPASVDDLRVTEETKSLGLRARLALGEAPVLELDLHGLWRPEDRRTGDGSSVRHRDRELFAQLALGSRPLTGWTWRLAYAFMDRDAGVLAPQLSAVNQRQLMEGGYRFPSGFEFTGGLRWDVDSFDAAPFDGGHLRFAARW